MANEARWERAIVDGAGNIIPYAQVEVRLEDTGFPLATLHSDFAGASGKSNPFTCLADGIAAFHTAGGFYKITITAPGYSETLRYQAIGTSQGFDQEAFVPAQSPLDATGAYNVRWFGATGDGVTDDSAAFQSAIDTIDLAGGGMLMIPVGVYCVHGLAWNGAVGECITLCGMGLATKLQSNGSTADLFTSNGGDVIVRDMTIQASSSGYQTAGTFLLFKGGRCLVDNVRFYNGYNIASWIGQSGNVISGGGAQNVNAVGNKNNGFKIDCSPSTSAPYGGLIAFSNCQLQGITTTTGWGVYLISGDSVIMSDMNVAGYVHNIIMLTDASHGYLANIFATNVFADGAGGTTTPGNGWHIDGTNQFLARVFLTNCWAGAMLNEGFYLDDVYTLEMTNCMVIANATPGIDIQSGCQDISIIGGVITGNSLSSSGNYSGIVASGTVTGLRIEGVRIGPTKNGVASGTANDTQKYGIDISAAGVTKVQILDNDLNGNVTGRLNNASTGTNNRIERNAGYNPVGMTAAANVGTSPATITAGASPETHYVRQSATNTATVAKGGRQIHTLAGATTYYQIDLEPNESYVVTWATTQPTYTKHVH